MNKLYFTLNEDCGIHIGTICIDKNSQHNELYEKIKKVCQDHFDCDCDIKLSQKLNEKDFLYGVVKEIGIDVGNNSYPAIVEIQQTWLY